MLKETSYRVSVGTPLASKLRTVTSISLGVGCQFEILQLSGHR